MKTNLTKSEKAQRAAACRDAGREQEIRGEIQADKTHGEIHVTEAARHQTTSWLGVPASQEAISESIKSCAAVAEAVADGLADLDQKVGEMACQAGCTHCCYLKVHVTPIEILALTAYVLKLFSTHDLQALKERLTVLDDVTHGMSEDERVRARVPCPLLEDEKCTVYEMRPLECRAYASSSAEACRAVLEEPGHWDVPVWWHRYTTFKHAQAGQLLAIAGAYGRFDALELNAALRIALETPDAVELWLSGTDVFEEARLEPTDSEYLALQPWTPTFWVQDA